MGDWRSIPPDADAEYAPADADPVSLPTIGVHTPPDWKTLATYWHDMCLRLQRHIEGTERELPSDRPTWEPWPDDAPAVADVA